jgi:SAM-dependent methyltransferase
MTTAETATSLFPKRVPEATEAMSPAESGAHAAWTSSPQGRAVYAALATHVVQRLATTRGQIVSVGEGEGLLAHEIANQLPSCSVIGTDISADAVERARTKHQAPNLRYEVAAAAEIGRLGPSGAVICAFALHHFADPGAAIRAMVEATTAGGRVYIQDLRRDANLGVYTRMVDMYAGIDPVVASTFRASVNAAYTPEELAALLAPHAGKAEVGRVKLGDAAREAYRKTDPNHGFSLDEALAVVDGLWVEALLVKPA